MEKLSVLVADDHWVARAAVSHLLNKLDREIDLFEAANGDELNAALNSAPALNLIILDLNMPGCDAWSTIRNVRKSLPMTPLIVISASEKRADVLRSLQEGAVGYVPKSAEPDVILSTVKRVLAGEVALPQRLLVKQEADQGETIADDRELAQVCAALEHFTPRQREIFGLLATGAQNKDIARTLDLSVNTVRVHMQAITSKLKISNRSEIALCAARWKERAADAS